MKIETSGFGYNKFLRNKVKIMLNKKEKINLQSPDKIHWDMYIDDSQLSKRELYLADHCRQRKFTFLLNDAKKFWVENGGTLSVRAKIEQGDTCVNCYDFDDLRNAMAYYVKNNPDRIKEMDKESARRYRLRQKNKIAAENVSKGLSPVVYRGRVVWASIAPNDECKAQVANNCYPTVFKNKIVWQPAPAKH